MSILQGAGFGVGPMCDSRGKPVSLLYFIAVWNTAGKHLYVGLLVVQYSLQVCTAWADHRCGMKHESFLFREFQKRI
jgi:hypothetical protein